MGWAFWKIENEHRLQGPGYRRWLQSGTEPLAHFGVVFLLCSVPTFTVIPEGPRSPSPLMVVDNEEEPMEGVPLEQYRAWLGEKTLEVGSLGWSFIPGKRKGVGSENFQ